MRVLLLVAGVVVLSAMLCLLAATIPNDRGMPAVGTSVASAQPVAVAGMGDLVTIQVAAVVSRASSAITDRADGFAIMRTTDEGSEVSRFGRTIVATATSASDNLLHRHPESVYPIRAV